MGTGGAEGTGFVSMGISERSMMYNDVVSTLLIIKNALSLSFSLSLSLSLVCVKQCKKKKL